MASIIRMGHPTLRKIAQDIDPAIIESKEFQNLIDDMIETMREAEGIGLAAPQIDQSIQLAVIEFPLRKIDDEDHPPVYVFINPKMELMNPEKTAGHWEGCLSVPGLQGFVERPLKVKVTYLDRHGQAEELIAEGFSAVVIQHELDHLQGILYVDRIKDTKLLAYNEEFSEFIAADED